jgi:O-acetyl-ADP-ribose deacetylase (regulator of RNase III)
MDYRQGFTAQSYPEEATVERGCRALWDRLEALGEQGSSVAMVALGAGTGNLGLRRSVEIACRTLREHLARTPVSALGAVTFFGYTLPEFLVTLEVVREHFEVPEDCIPDELRHAGR